MRLTRALGATAGAAVLLSAPAIASAATVSLTDVRLDRSLISASATVTYSCSVPDLPYGSRRVEVFLTQATGSARRPVVVNGGGYVAVTCDGLLRTATVKALTSSGRWERGWASAEVHLFAQAGDDAGNWHYDEAHVWGQETRIR